MDGVNSYYLRWIGRRANGKPWSNTWVKPRHVSDEAIADWNRRVANGEAGECSTRLHTASQSNR